MFQNFYTTKMSGNAKSLQKRFSKIRAGKSKTARFMAMIMTVAILAATLGGAVVLAAIGEDGLEYWDKNEIYFLDGVQFSVNVSGKNVPAWVWEDVAGEDGKIDVSMKRFQIRDTYGTVKPERIIEISGTKGVATLSSNSYFRYFSGIGITPPDAQNKISDYSDWYGTSFHEPNNRRDENYWTPPIDIILSENSGKHRHVELYFCTDEKMGIQTAFISFLIGDENDNVYSEQSANATYHIMDIDASALSYIGSFETDYIADYSINHPEVYFTAFEENYKNRVVDGFDINISNITPEEIRIDTAITHPQAKHIAIKIYDENQCIISDGDASAVLQYPQYSYGQSIPIQDMYIMVPSLQFYRPGQLPENFISGENYRICIAVFDDNYNVIYRWQEYVTMQ